jgi:DNA-binding transcriptional LysR family regulator
MNRIEDYQAFAGTVEKRSLTAAAHRLGRSLQSVSRSLATLERDVGVALIRRTTRRSNPTDAGLAFYRRLSAALAEIEAAKLETANRRVEATGLLRIAGSSLFSPLYIAPALPEFLAAHPKVEAELELSDGYVDLIDEGYDLAKRALAIREKALGPDHPNVGKVIQAANIKPE